MFGFEKMNKIIVVGIITVMLLNVTVTLAGFSYLQNEINQLKTEDIEQSNTSPPTEPTDPELTPEPSAREPTEATEPEPTPQESIEPEPVEPEPERAYVYVVYEWYLKAEYMNNVTWLNWTRATTTQGGKILRTAYDSNKTWSENYIAHIKSQYAIPKDLDPNMGVLAKAAFIRYVSVNASFNEETGYTKAIYTYEPSLYYAIESSLERLADGRGWTKTVQTSSGETTEVESTLQEHAEPEQSKSETTNTDGTAEYTFIVYRWWNGNVTRDMLNKVYAGRSVILAPLLFTYRLNSTYGMAAYYPDFGQGFSTVTSDFENVLTEITEKWTKTNEIARIPYYVYQTTDHPEYAHLFP
jgi:hypothetical protein